MPYAASAVHLAHCSDGLGFLLLLLSLLCSVPPCLSVGSRQQHNVWYNGLQITGIAVDEASGDVFFSDAAANRVLRQAADGALLAVYEAGFYSPQQLAYDKGKLYVADSTNNRVAVIDVASGGVTFSPPSPHLSSCSALALNNETGSLFVADGYGLMVDVFSPVSGDGGEWAGWVDISSAHVSPRPNYLASVAVQPHARDDRTTFWLSDPTHLRFYVVNGGQVGVTNFGSQYPGVTAIQHYWANDSIDQLYVLTQTAADEPMTVVLLNTLGRLISTWTASGRGGATVPFYGWAMHVDSQRNMYISDHGVDEQSKYGRVVKIAPNGTELGQWSMSDGVAYAPTSMVYDDQSPSDSSCVFWMVDSESGVVRAAANGTLQLPFYDAPVDPADGLTARFTGMVMESARSVLSGTSTLVLLDTASASITKLWRFLPSNGSYVLLNTSSAELGPSVTGIAVDAAQQFIFVPDLRSRNVLLLDSTGQLLTALNLFGIAFVEPAGLYHYQRTSDASFLFVVDSGYGGSGAVVQLDYLHGSVVHVFNDTTPPMFRPLTVAVDAAAQIVYTADSHGYVFQFDLNPPYVQQAVHQPIPAATHISSMTVSPDGTLYMIDAYSRRLVLLMRDSATWKPDSACTPRLLPSSSSSSSSTAAPPLHSSTATWSSTGPPAPVTRSRSQWPVSVTVALVVLVVLLAASGVTCWYGRRKKRQSRDSSARRDVRERLMAAEGPVGKAVDVKYDEEQGRFESTEKKADDTDVEGEGEEQASANAYDPPTMRAADVQAKRDTARRYEYYLARYEVVAAVAEPEQRDDDDDGRLQAQSGSGRWLSIHASQHTLQLPHTSSRSIGVSRAAASTASTASLSSNSTNTNSSSPSSLADYLISAPSRSSSTAAANRASGSSSTSTTSSPSHIAELQSAWRTTPTFIDSVTDLTILGEGSSGVVYRGMYRGVACVVKLPKSVSLTGAAWREWQCHLSLPPHANLVRFLGALPMAATNYLVLFFVRQGSLHSLLISSTPSSVWYGRPYAVMRCLRDMSAALAHIHRYGIVHRDVSCRNILVDSDGRMVLADLGLAAQQLPSMDAHTPVVDESKTAVPVRWTSPESLASGSQYSSLSDVWSLGVALWEMTAGGRLPYSEHGTPTKECIRPIIAGQWRLYVDEQWGTADSISEAERKLAATVRRLIALCLTHEMERRPDSEQLEQLVETEWEAWEAEAGEEAERVESEWRQHHSEVQRKLGPPSAARSCTDRH